MSTTRIEIGAVGIPPSEEDLRPAPLPQTIVMNFAKVCNLWCLHCFYPDMATKRERTKSREIVFLPPETFRRVADELAAWTNGVVLRIASDGEPLLHPEAFEMIAYAKSRGVATSLTTNGIPLSPENIAKLLDAGIDVIDISIDAATAESYAAVRPSRSGKNFYEQVEANVQNLIACRNRREGSPTKVMVNLIHQPRVRSEVDLFIGKWSAKGADAVLIRPFHTTSTLTVREGTATHAEGIRRFPCKYPFTRLNVGFDPEGHPVVYYCSHDWEEKTVVGVLGVDGNLKTIWQGPRMEEIRRRHRENRYPPDSFCAPCPDWYLGWGKGHHQLVKSLT
jgi:molybdenum cofactor biosynthesis enzyme MoaA